MYRAAELLSCAVVKEAGFLGLIGIFEFGFGLFYWGEFGFGMWLDSF
jgi:hypothetical protein